MSDSLDDTPHPKDSKNNAKQYGERSRGRTDEKKQRSKQKEKEDPQLAQTQYALSREEDEVYQTIPEPAPSQVTPTGYIHKYRPNQDSEEKEGEKSTRPGQDKGSKDSKGKPKKYKTTNEWLAEQRKRLGYD